MELSSVLYQLSDKPVVELVMVLTADRVNLDPVSRPYDGLSRRDCFLWRLEWPGAALCVFAVPYCIELGAESEVVLRKSCVVEGESTWAVHLLNAASVV